MNPERLYQHSMRCWKRHGVADKNPELLAKMDELLNKRYFRRSGGLLIGRELADLLLQLNELVKEDQSELDPNAPRIFLNRVPDLRRCCQAGRIPRADLELPTK